MVHNMIDRISSQDFADAVARAGGVTKAATLLDVSSDSVKRWRRSGVPDIKQQLVQEVLARFLKPGGGTEGEQPQWTPPGLRGYSNAELLLEIARRLADSSGGVHQHANASPANDDVSYDAPNVTRGTHYGISGPPGRRTPREGADE